MWRRVLHVHLKSTFLKYHCWDFIEMAVVALLCLFPFIPQKNCHFAMFYFLCMYLFLLLFNLLHQCCSNLDKWTRLKEGEVIVCIPVSDGLGFIFLLQLGLTGSNFYYEISCGHQWLCILVILILLYLENTDQLLLLPLAQNLLQPVWDLFPFLIASEGWASFWYREGWHQTKKMAWVQVNI